MSLQKTDSIEGARAKFIARAGHMTPAVERLPLADALGRVLAVDVYAAEDIPSFDRSIVDGYAVRSADMAAAAQTGGFLRMTEAIAMGEAPKRALESGECAYVPTGAMLPEGADAMVMVEDTARDEAGRVTIRASAPPWATQGTLAVGAGIARAGEDMKRGGLVLSCGALLRPCDVGALAANGRMEVPVYSLFRLSVISTGDELVEPRAAPRSPPQGAEVRDVNTSALVALAAGSGYRVASSVVLRDDATAITEAVRGALGASDVVVVSGGSSMGERDLTAEVFKEITGEENIVHGIAVKPGKPTIVAFDARTQTVLMGLPGHPVSAMMTFRLMLAWFYRKLTGQREPFPIPARLCCDAPGTPGRTTLQAVALHLDGTGYKAEPVFGKSGMITTMTRADGFFVIDADALALEGTAVLVYPC